MFLTDMNQLCAKATMQIHRTRIVCLAALFLSLSCVGNIFGQGLMPPTNASPYIGPTSQRLDVYTLQPVAEGSTNAEATADSEIVGYIKENGQTNIYVGESSYPQWIRGRNYVVELTPDGYAHVFSQLWTTTDLAGGFHADYLRIDYGPWEAQRFFK